jgi:DNA-binding transcriptional LysR family regulator
MALDIRQLQHVVAIGRFRNFGRAAESLGISQPALSKSLNVIERDLEVRLFERSRSGVTPTAFGELLMERAGPLLHGLDEAQTDIRRLRGLEAGSLAVGAGPFAFELIVATAVAAMAKDHPRLLLRLVEGYWDSLTREVLAGSLDIAVAEVTDAEQEPRLSVERLGERRGVFYCRAGHPLLDRPSPSFKEIAAYPLALNPLPGRISHFFERAGAPGRLDPVTGHFHPAITVASVPLRRMLVKETDAVSWAPTALIETELRAGTLVALPLDPGWARLNYGIIRRADRPATPAEVAFIAELRSAEARLKAPAGPPGSRRHRDGSASGRHPARR